MQGPGQLLRMQLQLASPRIELTPEEYASTTPARVIMSSISTTH